MINRNFIVGVFVSVSLAAILVMTLWLSGGPGATERASYSMFFSRDVDGLMLGGPVFFLGVEVGNVSGMQIIPGDPMRVRVDIEVLESTPIDTGTYASLLYRGITGVTVINLAGDRGMNLPLKRPPDDEFPVIEVRDSGLAAMLADAPSVIHKLDQLLSSANELFGEDNRAAVAETLDNLSRVSGALAGRERDFAELPTVIRDTLLEVQTGVSELLATVETLRPGLDQTVDHLAQATGKLSDAATRLDKWMANSDGEMQEFMGDGLGQVPALISETRETLREIEKLVRSLREDPSRLIYRPSTEEEANE